jgi:hypothetical protein
MGYEFSCSIPFAIGVVIAIALGFFITVSRLQEWTAKQINKNKAFVVVYNAGKEYRYRFSTIKEAAVNALERVEKGERVAYIEKDGEKVWDAFATTNKQSLWKLSGGE